MKLTVAEQAAYGSVFGAEYRKSIRSPPADVIHNHDKWEEWERGQATSAAEVAWSVVDRMREIRADMVAGFGEDSDVVEMYDACTGTNQRRGKERETR